MKNITALWMLIAPTILAYAQKGDGEPPKPKDNPIGPIPPLPLDQYTILLIIGLIIIAVVWLYRKQIAKIIK